ncbi:hypothetical protein KY312_01720, partial [Candidatus Woesearchaeota archaeon]|nr:hypothetical protein [Candidatus Woesearchaeota archaeon]
EFNINALFKKLNKRNIFRLLIYGKDNLIKFQRTINFLHPEKQKKLGDAIDSYVNYKWTFPERQKDLKKFVLKLFESKISNDRIVITSINKNNLIILKNHLKNIFKINSKLYFCKSYELNIQSRAEIQKLRNLY